MSDTEQRWQGTLRSYLTGFGLSIVCTVIAYLLVVKHLLSGTLLASAIFGLGIAQALVQLLFFLHLGKESKPRWNMVVFLFMVLILAIIVLGSLWIMNNLNDRVMPNT